MTAYDAEHQHLLQHWLTMQQAGLPLLFRELQQQLRENAAGFGAVSAPQRQLDPLPLLIHAADWSQLEAGILQRQQLLQLVLADLYGPQQYIRPDLLPADAVFRSPAFLLSAAGLLSAPADWLPLLSLDLVQSATGQWQVLHDHALIPAGLGYLVEHRLAFNHLAPVQAQALDIPKAQIAGFYRRLQQCLQGPHPQSEAEAALSGLWITSVHSRHYFEQAYLANYLDVTVVHGADLTFRDGALWLKTLTGLKPVSALLRYLTDADTDPLELEPAAGGCAGLLQSIRQQQLCCLNPPGSSVLDCGVLQPFLPVLSQALLGEPLLLQQPDMLWLGDQQQLQQFLAAPGKFRLRRISDQQQFIPALLETAALTSLLHRVQQDSGDYIATALLNLQHEPCWQPDTGLYQASAALRLFSLQDGNQSPMVLPGGYAQMFPDPLQLQAGESSAPQLVKDVWVLADRGLTASLLQNSSGALDLSRHSGLVTSRVADHLFWLGRYNERLNQICRALRTALQLVNAGTGLSQLQDVVPLLQFCRQANGLAGDAADLDALLQQLFDPAQPGSLFAILQALLFNAQSAREYFAADTWLVLDKLQQALRALPALQQQGSALLQSGPCLRQLDDIILLQTAFYGLSNETMSRTQALRLMDLGQHIERGLQTAALLQSVFVPAQGAPRPSAVLMEAVLRLADTVNTYRRRYRSQLHPLAVIDLLVFDESTPRSVGYQCLRIQRQCADLPLLAVQPGLSAEQRLALELVTLLQLTEPQSLFDAEQAATPALGLLLSQIQHRLKLLSDSITLSYFNHAPPSSSWQSF